MIGLSDYRDSTRYHDSLGLFTIMIAYAAKLSSGKTFVVVHKIRYSLENFGGVSGHGHHLLYTASDWRGKLSRST